MTVFINVMSFQFSSLYCLLTRLMDGCWQPDEGCEDGAEGADVPKCDTYSIDIPNSTTLWENVARPENSSQVCCCWSSRMSVRKLSLPQVLSSLIPHPFIRAYLLKQNIVVSRMYRACTQNCLYGSLKMILVTSTHFSV